MAERSDKRQREQIQKNNAINIIINSLTFGYSFISGPFNGGMG